jgi:thiosulfate dehydrogenase
MEIQRGDGDFFRSINAAVGLVFACLLLLIGTCCFYMVSGLDPHTETTRDVLLSSAIPPVAEQVWTAPDSTLIPRNADGDLIRYGKDLIAHTATYLGPRGKVMQISNGMNCQNCHLKAGTKPFGNNYAGVVSTYPKFRARSGTIETIEKRINDCLERSLNGQKLKDDSREMRAIIAWFRWLGKDVAKGSVPPGTGIKSLTFLQRAADPGKGRLVYSKHCGLCHGPGAEGFKYADSLEWKYPPLAGTGSYSTGAGLFRLSRFAGYVKSNMPHGTTYDKPILTDEEAWDVAAYINSLPRPEKMFAEDWPDIAAKPFDHPFGPYADTFAESQHKFGPFDVITAAKK